MRHDFATPLVPKVVCPEAHDGGNLQTGAVRDACGRLPGEPWSPITLILNHLTRCTLLPNDLRE